MWYVSKREKNDCDRKRQGQHRFSAERRSPVTTDFAASRDTCLDGKLIRRLPWPPQIEGRSGVVHRCYQSLARREGRCVGITPTRTQGQPLFSIYRLAPTEPAARLLAAGYGLYGRGVRTMHGKHNFGTPEYVCTSTRTGCLCLVNDSREFVLGRTGRCDGDACIRRYGLASSRPLPLAAERPDVKIDRLRRVGR